VGALTLGKKGGTLAAANLKSVSFKTEKYGTAGYKFTIDAVIHDTGSPSDFYKNGLKYSAAAMTLDQTNTNAAAGILVNFEAKAAG